MYMSTFRKILTYLLIILFCISIYQDLTSGTPTDMERKQNFYKRIDIDDNTLFEVVTIEVQEGETVLSIIEKLNEEQMDTLNITKLLNDFMMLNPNVDPYHLNNRKKYQFPIYK